MQPSSESERPVAVWIVAPDPVPDGLLQPILWGLEEEGIPAQIQPSAAGHVAEMAKLAADGSPLNVGIAVCGADGAVALHHRDLAAPQPLFVLREPELEPARLRRLGANAARLVKGDPLAVGDEPEPAGEPAAAREPAASAAAADLVEEIAALVVARLLSERRWRPIPSNGHAT
jgi:propanediol dehydratase-reactivating factor small subunit